MGIVWYRVEDYQTAAPVDEFERVCGPSETHLRLRRFEVIKTTPCGVWLATFDGPRFTRRDARKRFACPTLAEAIESFQARKKRQAAILMARAAAATKTLDLSKRADYFIDKAYPGDLGLEFVARVQDKDML